MASDFMIGMTEGGLTALDELPLPLPDPQWEFLQFRTKEKVASGMLKGRGPRTTTWEFPLINTSEIAQLEAYQSDNHIYIQSRKRDGSLAIFEVIANWIDPREDGDHIKGLKGYRSNLNIEFVIIQELV